MRRRPLRERLLEKIEVNSNGCWLWQGFVHSSGYGWVADGPRGPGRWQSAHRASYKTFVEPIAEGLEIHHRCETKRCINPDHLRAVSRLEHRALTPLAGATKENAAKTHCKRGHELAGDNVYAYRGFRHCRTCRRDASRESWRVRTGYYNARS